MADFNVTTKRSNIDPAVRANIYAKIYAEILRWSPSWEKTAEPATEDIRSDTEVGSKNETLTREAEDD